MYIDGIYVNTEELSNPSVPEPIRVLKYGESGKRVKVLQGLLNANGFGNEGTFFCDGKFGNLTLLAVKNFQKANNLIPDGTPGRLTFTKLKNYRRG